MSDRAPSAAARTHSFDWIRLLGWLVTVVALVFVARRAFDVGGLELRRLADPLALGTLAGSVLAYAALCVLLALAWRRLLRRVGVDLGVGAAYAIFGRTQIAKYLPGNVFHIAGRQLGAVRAGVSAMAAGASLTLEHLSLISAAAALGLGHLLLVGSAASGLAATTLSPTTLALIGLAAAASTWLVGRLARRVATLLERRGRVAHLEPLGRVGLEPGAYTLHLAFFLGAGSLLIALGVGSRSLPTIGAAGSAAIVLAFAPAWLAGLVTPGAAAGLGVREAVLLASLDGVGVAADDGLFLALALRLATTLGDVVVWLASLGTDPLGLDPLAAVPPDSAR